MSSTPPPRAYSTEEREVNAKFDAFFADARSGKAKPPPEWVPQRSAFDIAVRQAIGIEDPETPTDNSPVHMGMSDLKSSAWDSFTDAEQEAINAGDPELSALYDERYRQAIEAANAPDEEAEED
jgi:hypothetical protein